MRTGRTRTIIGAALAWLALTGSGAASEGGTELLHPERPFPFYGMFGHYDEAALQRGLTVYLQVCSSCHGLKYLAYRNLGDPGGPGLSEAEVKALAERFRVPAGPDEEGNVTDENGLLRMRTALPSDRFAAPYPNEQAARATNGGALPPDLSLMAKARMGGPAYIYSLLQGFREVPAGLNVPDGQHYNIFFAGDLSPFWDGPPDQVPPGGTLAMTPPLSEGLITYDDGTPATLEQMSYDVAQFLMWSAEPKLEQRKRMGLQVIVFLSLLTVLLYLTYRRIWRNVSK